MAKRRICGTTLGFAAALGMLLLPGAAAEEPPLPPGLARESAKPAEPALPPGLGGTGSASATGEPALPAGLGGTAAPAEPALPPGLGGASDTAAPEETKKRGFPLEVHGFFDVRGGMRTHDDPAYGRDATLGEARLQLETEKAWDRAVFELTADFIGDGVIEEGDFDLRQARLTWTVTDRIDLRIGRQVLTWGTGDMLFLNDLFPKDWQAFFSGRDVEYLKAPSDAAKLGLYTRVLNAEFVYTPQFGHDRFITGERVSFYNPLFNRFDGDKRQVTYNAPSDWFEDDEFALRLYRNAGPFEVALYSYSGYWKSPGGQRLIPFMQAAFPKLAVHGASLRGPIGKGVFNAETAYYDSRQDRDGSNMLVSNSEFRLLLGYERELAKDFTGAFQYYFEHMMDYAAYRNSMLAWMPKRGEDRHVFTLRLTKMLMRQNLTLSLFAYWSPSGDDAYLRPYIEYKMDDHWKLFAGGNVFMGEEDASFFGQFENSSNVYAGFRFAF